MKLRINYSIASEVEVVRETLADLDFIIENDYQFWLPNGVDGRSTDENIRQAVIHEFDPKIAQQFRLRLKIFYKSCVDSLGHFAFRCGGQPLASLQLSLTRYGTGGYYELPNRIIVNLHQAFDTPESVLVHELVHLLIEKSIVQKFKLDHAAKEGLVDYLITNSPLLRSPLPDYHTQVQTTLPSDEVLASVAPLLI